jgi:hypothetical protein
MRLSGSPWLKLALALDMGSLAACSPTATAPPPASAASQGFSSSDSEMATTPETSPQNPWESCYSTFGPTGHAENDLGKLVRDCGPAGGMRPVTQVRVASQAQEDPVDRYTFEVPTAGRCYRIYAASDGAVQDLDLLLRTPAGDPVVADVTHDSWPVVPPRAPICFPEPGTYVLEVSVYKGSGRYALQVWGR